MDHGGGGESTVLFGDWASELSATVAPHTSPQATLRPGSISEHQRAVLRVGALPALTRATEQGPPELALGKTLGQGGMGVVRLAQQLSLGREVAVKMLRGSPSGQLEATRALLQEAMVTGLLEHPNIIPVYALGQGGDGSPMLVMKRVEGTVWSDVLAQPDHPLRRGDARDELHWNLDVLRQVCNAVAFAHDRGIVHRDLKPDNVMIGRFGEVYLVDWGVAAALSDDRSGALPLLADSQGPVGTPCYMAPEQVRGLGPELGTHTDVFLLGAMLYRIIAGDAPWGGTDAMSVLFAAYACQLPGFDPTVPAELAAICAKAMSRDPADRHASALEFGRALDIFIAHRASIRLAEAAQALLPEVGQALAAARQAREAGVTEPGASWQSLSNTMTEVQVTLREALRVWPENPRALAALEQVHGLAARAHLDAGRIDDAREIAALLPHDTELVHLIEKAEQVRAYQDEELARLRQSDRDWDRTAGAWVRTRMLLLVAVIWGAGPILTHAVAERFQLVFDHRAHLVSTGLFAMVLLIGGRMHRELLQATEMNRRIVRGVRAVIAIMFAVQGMQWILHVPMPVALGIDQALYGTAVALIGATLDPRIMWAAVPFFLASAAVFAYPPWYWLICGLGNMLGLGAAALAWSSLASRKAAWIAQCVILPELSAVMRQLHGDQARRASAAVAARSQVNAAL